MRVRKNKVTLAPAESRLDALAMKEGLQAAELAACRQEAQAGVPPVLVTPEGLVCEDYVHLLVLGERSFEGLVNGALFYNPVSDEAVLVKPKGRQLECLAAPLGLQLMKAISPRQKLLLDAACHAATAYDDGDEALSRWIIRKVKEAALLGGAQDLDRKGPPSWKKTVPRNPRAAWRALGKHWVGQQWGLGTHVEVMGAWK